MSVRRMAAQAKGLAAQAIRGSAAALTVLMVSSLPARAIPQCIAYNIVASGGSERGDINTFEELCGPAVPKRQTCGCLTRSIGNGFSTPLSRHLFRIEVLVDAYPFYQSKLTIYQLLCYPERRQGPDGLHELCDPTQAPGEAGELGARHLGGLARQMFFSAGVGW